MSDQVTQCRLCSLERRGRKARKHNEPKSLEAIYWQWARIYRRHIDALTHGVRYVLGVHFFGRLRTHNCFTVIIFSIIIFAIPSDARRSSRKSAFSCSIYENVWIETEYALKSGRFSILRRQWNGTNEIFESPTLNCRVNRESIHQIINEEEMDI